MSKDKQVKSHESLQTYHPRPGIKVTVTPVGCVVEHSGDLEYSVSVNTTGQIVSQNGGRSTCSMVLAKGLKG
jgi:hypothetical protein